MAETSEKLPDSRGGSASWRRYLRALGIAGSLLFLVLLFTVLSALHDNNFVSTYNLQTMAQHAVTITLGAIGMTLVIVSGGIDLSVGSVIALSSVVTGWALERAGLPLEVAVLAGVLTGGVAGCINGVVITAFRIVPFIATLGMMTAARGAAKLAASSKQIDIDYEGWTDSWLYLSTVNPNLQGGEPVPGLPYLPGWMLLAPAVWVTLGLVIFMTIVLRKTVFGRHVFAIGSNESAARLCGVPVARTKLCIYTLCGTFAGMAGIIFCSRQSQGDPTAAVGYELDIIAAVVIGGGSLTGGEGSIFGSLFGALIMIVLRTGLRMVRAPSPVQEILIGVIIIVAVVMDHLQHRKAE